MKLQNKIAIITGAGRGIGKAIALRFAQEGANLAMTSRTIPELQATRDEVAALGGQALALSGDVSHWEDVERLVKATLDEFGAVDILVNSAGVQGPIGPVTEVEVAPWVETIHINLIGTFLCCRAVLPTMLARHKGKVINFSGGGALYPRARFTAYSASKAGVIRFTESLAQEVKGSNVQVNAIAPGAVKTRLWDELMAAGDKAGEEALAEAHRLQETGWVSAEPAASLAVFLASSDSDGLTGRIISAIHDDWQSFPGRIEEVMATEYYTMRRINLPKKNG